jgi:hypothetical protein
VFDLGAVVPLAVNIKDSTGALANAGTVTLTVTLPDGTTTTPTVSNASTGVYTASFPTTQVGRHVVNWAATGTNASAYEDVFDVRATGTTLLVSLADAKSYLNIDATDTTNDDELRSFIGGVTRVIESYVGACSRRTVVDTFTGYWQEPRITPKTQPIISITSVVERGVTLDPATEYALNDQGTVIRTISGGSTIFPRGWWYGINNVVITYVAGRAVIPDNILEAAKELIRVNWRTQRGGSGPSFDGDIGDYAAANGDQIRLGFYVPGRVLDQLKPDLDVAAGIA